MRIKMQEELTHVGAMNNVPRIWTLIIRTKKNHNWMLSIVCAWSVDAKSSDQSCRYNDNRGYFVENRLACTRTNVRNYGITIKDDVELKRKRCISELPRRYSKENFMMDLTWSEGQGVLKHNFWVWGLCS